MASGRFAAGHAVAGCGNRSRRRRHLPLPDEILGVASGFNRGDRGYAVGASECHWREAAVDSDRRPGGPGKLLSVRNGDPGGPVACSLASTVIIRGSYDRKKTRTRFFSVSPFFIDPDWPIWSKGFNPSSSQSRFVWTVVS